jgi:hypothetical protein
MLQLSPEYPDRQLLQVGGAQPASQVQVPGVKHLPCTQPAGQSAVKSAMSHNSAHVQVINIAFLAQQATPVVGVALVARRAHPAAHNMS